MSTGTHTLIQRQDALTALRNLHRVCAAMADAEAVIGSAA